MQKIYIFALSQRHSSAFVYRDGMGACPSITYIHLKNPISILTTPNENWGRKVGVIKFMTMGKVLKL